LRVLRSDQIMHCMAPKLTTKQQYLNLTEAFRNYCIGTTQLDWRLLALPKMSTKLRSAQSFHFSKMPTAQRTCAALYTKSS
jgi:hypothetical protein